MADNRIATIYIAVDPADESAGCYAAPCTDAVFKSIFGLHHGAAAKLFGTRKKGEVLATFDEPGALFFLEAARFEHGYLSGERLDAYLREKAERTVRAASPAMAVAA